MVGGSVEGVFVDLDNIGKLLTDDIAILVDVPELSAVHIALVNARRYITAAAETGGTIPEQRTIQTLHDMSVRREALIKFYERVIDYFKDDLLERLLFIQCLAALDSDEGHSLAWLYTDEFNRTLIQYQDNPEQHTIKTRDVDLLARMGFWLSEDHLREITMHTKGRLPTDEEIQSCAEFAGRLYHSKSLNETRSLSKWYDYWKLHIHGGDFLTWVGENLDKSEAKEP